MTNFRNRILLNRINRWVVTPHPKTTKTDKNSLGTPPYHTYTCAQTCLDSSRPLNPSTHYYFFFVLAGLNEKNLTAQVGAAAVLCSDRGTASPEHSGQHSQPLDESAN